ncbi:phage protease [Endozoicomonas gorgoniicola]|uniref:Phage protease n=1 Tax=Endozoicomonas gorgoniicola TaxID=1234144 RepID=A0ABT3N2N6_9GAMM|nr:phage protease [Endozoicomonas gorgoniicola]MCW7555889.1 phage protease [Endozoicomonas gorgoniicola]
MKQWVKLIPAGEFQSLANGQMLNNDTPSTIVSNFKDSGWSIPVDLQHATILKAPNGEPAPAQAWIEELEDREGEVWGRMDWNKDGLKLARAERFNKLLPALQYDKNTGRIKGIRSVALIRSDELTSPALNHEICDGSYRLALNSYGANLDHSEAGATKQVLTAQQKQICEMMSISEADFIKTLNELSPDQ